MFDSYRKRLPSHHVKYPNIGVIAIAPYGFKHE